MNDLRDTPDADRRIERDLASALRLQRLLAGISSRFVTRPAEQMDETIEETQRLICETLEVDRSTLWQSTEDSTGMALTHFWQKPGCAPLRRNYVTQGNLPWCDGKLKRGESFHFSTLADLPAAAAKDAETLRLHGTQSNATYPLLASGKVYGALAFGMITRERHWADEEIASLKLVAEMFSHVIRRQRAENRAEQLRAEIQGYTRASMLGELAATLAHEINQPLTTILGNAQAARRFILHGTASQDEIITILDDIIRDDKRAGEIIRSLRAVLSDAPLPHAPGDLNRLVTEVTGFLAKELAKQDTSIVLDLSDPLPQSRFARIEIQQLLHNLILNAARSMSDTAPECRRILVQTRHSDSHIQVRVMDHGAGISPEQIDRIFEPFHTTRPDGLGMGLAICRRIAESHGGSLEASNKESGGAVFTLTLPSGATSHTTTNPA